MVKYLINLKSRPDRLFNSLAQIPDLIRFEAIEGGAEGCKKSHQAIIKLAMKQKLQMVQVMEDDFVITDNRLQEAIDSLPSNFDILYLGGRPKKPLKRYNDILFHCEETILTHALVYSERVYHKILGASTPIDQFLRFTIQRNGRCYFTDMVKQRADYSDILGKEVPIK